MRPVDIMKTAIVTPFGLFEFLNLPFGLRNVAQTFQRMMDQIFGDLPFCFVYLDGVLIFSKDLQSHQNYRHDVLQLCRDHSLTINLMFFRYVKYSIVSKTCLALVYKFSKI